MDRRSIVWFIIIVIVAIFATIIALPGENLSLGSVALNRQVSEGLDLKGGLRVLLEADVPAGQTLDAQSMETARGIVENRVNALGLAEPLVYASGNNRIAVELPGVKDPQLAVETIKQTGLLEFAIIPSGEVPPAVNTVVQTYCPDILKVDCGNPERTTAPLTATTTSTDTVPGPIYTTLMTGAALSKAAVTTSSTTRLFEIAFELGDAGARIFGDYTTKNVGNYLAIVLDKRIISAPRIESAITGGKGVINGSFTQESANQLALQLRYGALPVPLKIAQSQEVGPTLGQDSVRRSTLAGIIGLSAVALFMILYYRLPGITAVIALAIYAVVTFALFKLIPVTLTLPGIAGFILSVGVAVDANILIFERMKEELRGGRSLRNAVDTGFNRAWPSIRDSNASTLITCAILFWFGSTFGASIVKGFALTLALGVGVSLFTAILVTRTLMHIIMDRVDFSERHAWFGI